MAFQIFLRRLPPPSESPASQHVIPGYRSAHPGIRPAFFQRQGRFRPLSRDRPQKKSPRASRIATADHLDPNLVEPKLDTSPSSLSPFVPPSLLGLPFVATSLRR